MEVPRQGVKSELQLLAYTKPPQHGIWAAFVTYTTAPSNNRIPNPLSEARDGTRIPMDTSLICFHCATTGTPKDNMFSDFRVHHSCGQATFHNLLAFCVYKPLALPLPQSTLEVPPKSVFSELQCVIYWLTYYLFILGRHYKVLLEHGGQGSAGWDRNSF